MRIPNNYYLIIDVEATCSDIGEVPRQEMEIIEIGAVLQSARNFEIEATFQTFIQPVRHPELTAFCTELTGITQKEVESAPSFAAAIKALNDWMQPIVDALFCSWGEYDKGQFEQDCSFHQIAYPFRSQHMNLKAEFSSMFGLKKKLGVTDALRHLGLRFEGSHHRGLDDAKNMARIVRRACIGI